MDAAKVTQSTAVTEAGYAADARQLNAALPGTMANKIAGIENYTAVDMYNWFNFPTGQFNWCVAQKHGRIITLDVSMQILADVTARENLIHIEQGFRPTYSLIAVGILQDTSKHLAEIIIYPDGNVQVDETIKNGDYVHFRAEYFR